MTDPVKRYLGNKINSSSDRLAEFGKKTITSIKDPVINAWRTKSFGFAFWGVFVFGSILFSLVISITAETYGRFFPRPSVISSGMTVWGYCYLAYHLFSVFYLYRKASLLSVHLSKVVCFLLGFYLCFSAITFVLVGEFSLLFWVGEYIYKVANGVSTDYLLAIKYLSNHILNILRLQ